MIWARGVNGLITLFLFLGVEGAEADDEAEAADEAVRIWSS